jgi:hypothetical protein
MTGIYTSLLWFISRIPNQARHTYHQYAILSNSQYLAIFSGACCARTKLCESITIVAGFRPLFITLARLFLFVDRPCNLGVPSAIVYSAC